MRDRYLAIHGHFYQPPRENPWTGEIESQPTAAPFQNWNERVAEECYGPNAHSKLLDDQGGVAKLIDNYRYLNWDFGPTLLAWLEKERPETYAAIVAADAEAAQAHGGHGPAIAQVYNHVIMPLANERDKRTQIRWGRADFRRRFGRAPEGMWLAETAVDLETLRLLAEEGVKFTILCQTQAAAVRNLARGRRAKADAPWLDVTGGSIDPREPYRVFWGDGAKGHMDVFFYDGPVSRAVAFENLLWDGNTFLNRLKLAFGVPKAGGEARLVSVATDGESYGHHSKFGDMALAWVFNQLEEHKNDEDAIRPVTYGEYLAQFPPTKEVQIIENTSWSCGHGVERWRADCGCRLEAGTSQAWRAPLRQGLDALRDKLAAIFEAEGAKLLADPWAARDDYITVMAARFGARAKGAFLKKHAAKALSAAEKKAALDLMEAQRMALFMFTSCGWFFDDLAGLEPVQNLRYALRAIQLTKPWAKTDLEKGLLRHLAKAVPNDPAYKTGRDVWAKLVKPACAA